jgi:hypothetical protein
MVHSQKSWMECGLCFTLAVAVLTLAALGMQWALRMAPLPWN